MAAYKPLFFSLLAAMALSACASKVPPSHWAGERKDWRGWQGTWDDMTGWREWVSPATRAKYDSTATESGCTLWQDPRLTTQSGVSDYLAYTTCANTPSPAPLGTRFSGR